MADFDTDLQSSQSPLTSAQPPSYEDQAAPILSAFDQRIAAQKADLAAATQQRQATQALVQTAAAKHAATVAAVRGGQSALPGAATPAQSPLAAPPSQQPGIGGSQPQNLQDWLSSHNDDDFDKANAEIKQVHGKSADEMYDDLVDSKFIPPADQPLTPRQKGEAFTHMGLEILKNSTSKNRWSQNPLGAIGAGGEAAQDDIKQDRQQAAQSAYEDYLRTQNIGLKRAGEEDADEKEGVNQAAEGQRQSAIENQKNRFDAAKTDFEQAEQDKRNAADNAAKRATSKEADAKPQITVDENGYQIERPAGSNGQWRQSLDANGKPFKVQRSAEDEAKISGSRAKFIQDAVDKADAAYSKDPLAAVNDTDGSKRKAAIDAARDQATQIWDSGQKGGKKSVNWSDLQ